MALRQKKRENLMKLKYENVITEQLLTIAMKVVVATAAMSFQWFVLVHLAINDIVAA